MKKSLFTTVFAIAIAITAQAQNVGIGTSTPLEKLSVGSASQFRVDANGNITRINNVPYNFPSTQGGLNQILKNDGTGSLVWSNVPSLPKPVVRIFSIVNNGFSSWFIDQAADYNSSPFNSNPTLVLYRGLTYQFSIAGNGHPFQININNSAPYIAYTVGMTNNVGVSDGVITFTVPMDAPSTLYYICTIHPLAMNGVIDVK